MVIGTIFLILPYINESAIWNESLNESLQETLKWKIITKSIKKNSY